MPLRCKCDRARYYIGSILLIHSSCCCVDKTNLFSFPSNLPYDQSSFHFAHNLLKAHYKAIIWVAVRTRVNTTKTPATVFVCCDYRHTCEAVSSSLRLPASSFISAILRKPRGNRREQLCILPPPTSPACLPLRASSSLHFASSTFSKCHCLISRVSNDARKDSAQLVMMEDAGKKTKGHYCPLFFLLHYKVLHAFIIWGNNPKHINT